MFRIQPGSRTPSEGFVRKRAFCVTEAAEVDMIQESEVYFAVADDELV